jgi:hypothetical protein
MVTPLSDGDVHFLRHERENQILVAKGSEVKGFVFYAK